MTRIIWVAGEPLEVAERYVAIDLSPTLVVLDHAEDPRFGYVVDPFPTGDDRA